LSRAPLLLTALILASCVDLPDKRSPESFAAVPDVPDVAPDEPADVPDATTDTGADVPEDVPDVPDEGEDIPDEGEDVPDAAEDVPDEGPDVPDDGPDVPDEGPETVDPIGCDECTQFLKEDWSVDHGWSVDGETPFLGPGPLTLPGPEGGETAELAGDPWAGSFLVSAMVDTTGLNLGDEAWLTVGGDTPADAGKPNAMTIALKATEAGIEPTLTVRAGGFEQSVALSVVAGKPDVLTITMEQGCDQLTASVGEEGGAVPAKKVEFAPQQYHSLRLRATGGSAKFHALTLDTCPNNPGGATGVCTAPKVTCPALGECTHTFCNPLKKDCGEVAPLDGPCDDGNPCTDDHCTGGGCLGEPIECKTKSQCVLAECDPAKGGCVYTPQDELCQQPGGDPCVVIGCKIEGGCVPIKTSAALLEDTLYAWFTFSDLEADSEEVTSEDGAVDATVFSVGQLVADGHKGIGLATNGSPIMKLTVPAVNQGPFAWSAWVTTSPFSPGTIFRNGLLKCNVTADGVEMWVGDDKLSLAAADLDLGWHHVMCMLGDDDFMRVVVDGVATEAPLVASADISFIGTEMVIGEFIGAIDEVSLWTGSLPITAGIPGLGDGVPADDPCNDGLVCTIDGCDSDTQQCTHTTKVCDQQASECNIYQCDEDTGLCLETSVETSVLIDEHWNGILANSWDQQIGTPVVVAELGAYGNALKPSADEDLGQVEKGPYTATGAVELQFDAYVTPHPSTSLKVSLGTDDGDLFTIALDGETGNAVYDTAGLWGGKLTQFGQWRHYRIQVAGDKALYYQDNVIQALHTKTSLPDEFLVRLSGFCDSPAYIDNVLLTTGVPCTDENSCTAPDLCELGDCSTPSFECDDLDPCTNDFCEQAGGCKFTDNGLCDTDHDGVTDPSDLCPTVWTPDNSSTLCELPSGLTSKLDITLTQDGDDSTWHRTREPIEIPLANGVLDADLVVYLPLGEDTNFNDVSSHKHQVTATGDMNVGKDAFGDLGGAAEFGPKTSIMVAAGQDVNAGQDYTEATVSLRFKTDKAATGVEYLWYDHSAKGKTVIERHSSGAYLGRLGDKFVDCGTPDTPGWHHLALTWNGAILMCYLDGTVIQAVEAPLDSQSTALDGTWIGSAPGAAGTNFFQGFLDEVLYFRRALGPTELEAYRRSELPYGTTVVEGAQPDFDDVRMSELSKAFGATGTPVELFGARPHSDTELDGVLAYWPLDGTLNAFVTTGKLAGTDILDGVGRFGAIDGGSYFDGTQSHYSTGTSLYLDEGQPVTVEAWVLSDVKTGMGTVVGANIPGFFHLLLEVGAEQVCFKLATSPLKKGGICVPQKLGGRWRHLAGVRRDGNVELYIDGVYQDSAPDASEIISLGPNELFIGATNETETPTNFFKGHLAEVLVHSEAKSADYIFKRAQPGIPMARFLANTEPVDEDGDFAPMAYALRWGSADVAGSTPVIKGNKTATCEGLLSPCLGTVAWWRFDDPNENTPLDSATGRLHLAPTPNVDSLWIAPGVNSPALDIGGGGGFEIEATELLLPTYTVEAMAQPGDPAGEGTLCSYSTDDYGSNSNYRLRVGDGAIKASYEWTMAGAACGPPLSYSLAGDKWYTAAFSYTPGAAVLRVDHNIAQEVDCAGPLLIEGGRFTIGMDGSKENDPYTGLLDDVRISRRALAPDEQLHSPRLQWTLGE